MEVKITVLVENSVPLSVGLLGEHGLAFRIDAGDRKILFDTGQGRAIENNARFLGMKLEDADTIVFSHGHFDHTGGLPAFLEKKSEVDIVAHPDIFAEKFGRRSEELVLPIGIPMKKELIEIKGTTLRLETEPVELAPGISTTGEVPMETSFEQIEPNLLIKQDGEYVTDSLRDDLSLVLDTQEGVVVVLGCCHRGIINTLNRVNKLTGGKKINTVIGGLHLVHADDERIEKTIEALKGFDIEKIGSSHCTGPRATAAIMKEFGEKFFVAGVGTQLEFPMNG